MIDTTENFNTRTIPQVGVITKCNCISLLGYFIDNEDVFCEHYRLYVSQNTADIYRQFIKYNLIRDKRINGNLKAEKFRIDPNFEDNTIALYDIQNAKVICITE